MNICIFGDSIVWGGYDAKNGGWATRLQNHFMEQNGDIDVYNLGISDDTSSLLLKRIEIEAESRRADMIIIAIGINDAQFIHSTKKFRIPLDEFQQNLAKLLCITRKFTDKVIFIGLTQVDESETIKWESKESYKNENIGQFDDVIEKFCEENKLKFISMSDVISNDDLVDGLHPNATGHIKMFEKVKTEIKLLV